MGTILISITDISITSAFESFSETSLAALMSAGALVFES